MEKNAQEIFLYKGDQLATVSDLLDLIATIKYEENCNTIVLKKEQLHKDFFDLRTGFAGDVVQKLVNYHAKLIINGTFSMLSKNYQDFITESNTGEVINFIEEA